MNMELPHLHISATYSLVGAEVHRLGSLGPFTLFVAIYELTNEKAFLSLACKCHSPDVQVLKG